MQIKICDTVGCNKETKNRRFCCQKCSAITTNKEFPRRKTKVLVKRKKHLIPISELNHSSQRARMLKKHGIKCQNEKCGLTEWLGKPIPLQLDHIDGNPDNKMNQIYS